MGSGRALPFLTTERGLTPQCHECAGDGVVEEPVSGWRRDKGYDPSFSVCGSCGGTGVADDRDPEGLGRKAGERQADKDEFGS